MRDLFEEFWKVTSEIDTLFMGYSTILPHWSGQVYPRCQERWVIWVYNSRFTIWGAERV